MFGRLRRWALLLGLGLHPLLACGEPYLSPRNVEAPFAYLHGDTRQWPILSAALPAERQIEFSASLGTAAVSGKGRLEVSGLTIGLATNDFLRIESDAGAEAVSFSLSLRLLLPGGSTEEQTLDIRPAPTERPISYYADFGDDIIRIYMDAATGEFAPIGKDGLDQYFRRLQAQGISRLIAWLSPFPYAADPSAYSPEDWGRYEAQARAIVESEELSAAFLAEKQKTPDSEWGRYTPYGWVRQLLALRLRRDFGAMLSQSAEEHGVKLTASYRPFEPSLTKYYEIPAFDEQGNFLWGFLPMGSPTVNYHPDKLCFAHYRTLLREAGHEEFATLESIEIAGVENAEAFLDRFRSKGDNLLLRASRFPPLQECSFVLARAGEEGYRLRRYGEIASSAEERWYTVEGFEIELEGADTLIIRGLRTPDSFRFLLLSNPSGEAPLHLPTFEPVRMTARAGNRLSRENVYWVLNGSPETAEQTRVAGIRADGVQYSEFDATEACWKALADAPALRPLAGDLLVIDRGDPWSVETLDFNREEARANALAEIGSLLSYPAFDEVFINTRSHTQLAAYMGDGELGLRPIAKYRKQGKPYAHLGLDRAYAPISVLSDPEFAKSIIDWRGVESITTWNPGAWSEDCQTQKCPYVWRLSRNRAVAQGIRKLLLDLERSFPETRIRAVIPLLEETMEQIREGLETLPRPDGTFYGRGYYPTLGSTINHIRSIGEGMARVDLSGLKVEPVFFGIRFLIDPEPLDLFVRMSIEDLRDNRGSSYRGPRSFFYEAQETLRSTAPADARERREQTICALLSYEEEIGEVILYEAADWTYFLPFSDPDYAGHGYLDRCPRGALLPIGGGYGG